MTNKKKIFSNPYRLTLLSGILLVLSFPPFDLWFLAWIALAPFLYAIAHADADKGQIWRLSVHKAHVLGIMLGAVFYYATLFWLYNIFGFIALLLLAIPALYTFFFACILNFVLSRWKNRLCILFFPAVLWVSIEYFKSEGWWLKFSWMNLGYSQHSFLPTLQWASILGQYGISFLIVLVNSAVVFIIMNRSHRKSALGTFLAAALCIALVVSFGAISLRKEYTPEIRVGIVQDESSELPVYARLCDQLPEDIDFILWPEYAVPEIIEEQPDLI